MSEESRKGQLDLGINRQPERDRNFHLGGRSFYFFDFDDNIAFLTTPLILFHKDTREEVMISSGDFAQHHQAIGKSGLYADYAMDFCDSTGTFRNFRDVDLTEIEKLSGKNQTFVQDVAEALGFRTSNGKARLGNVSIMRRLINVLCQLLQLVVIIPIRSKRVFVCLLRTNFCPSNQIISAFIR